MKNYKNHYKKNRFRNNNDRGFKRNGGVQKFENNYSDLTEFKRKKLNRNINASKLAEKYTTLAKEALSNGDKISSENYYQHADHFNRINEKQNSIKQEQRNQENQNNLQSSESENQNNNLEIK